MKRLAIAVSMLVASSSVLANPIMDSLKSLAWVEYNCTINMAGQQVDTVTNQEQYTEFRMVANSPGTVVYSYSIEQSSVDLYIDPPSTTNNPNNKQKATAIVYKGITVIGTYTGICTKK